MLLALNQDALRFARRVSSLAIALAIGTCSYPGPAFAQSGGSTKLHDFDSVGDLSTLRTDRASYELVDGDRADHGQAIRISFDAVTDSSDTSPGLVFEKASMPNRDFSQIGVLSFWVKNESDSGTYIMIAVQDLDGKRSVTDPDKVYVSAGTSQHIVYRLDLLGLDRSRIGSLHLSRKSEGKALSLVFDDFELLSPLAGQIVSLENRIRSGIERVQASAKRIGLEAFVEADTGRLTQRFRDTSSCPHHSGYRFCLSSPAKRRT